MQKWNKNPVTWGCVGIYIICILLKNALNYKRYCGLDIYKDSIFTQKF